MKSFIQIIQVKGHELSCCMHLFDRDMYKKLVSVLATSILFRIVFRISDLGISIGEYWRPIFGLGIGMGTDF